MAKVFVAVLDWGLGHATRCIPVIKELQNQKFTVIVGASGQSLSFLKTELRDLKFYELPSYAIVYPANRNLLFSVFKQLPKVLKKINQENKILSDIINNEKIDFVISDNRYGCYSRKIKSIFICHQLNLQMPVGLSFLSGWVNKLHNNRIKNFDEVWIPDEKDGFKFSGILSKTSFRKIRYTGILSRFVGIGSLDIEKYDIVGIISGPEPQRTVFENILREQLIHSNRKALLVKGKPGTNSTKIEFLNEVDHLGSKELESALLNCSVVISRSGYSTLMDLSVLGKKVIFIPTPGQTEQEYLGDYFFKNGLAVVQHQNNLNLEEALDQVKLMSSLPVTKPNSRLEEAIKSLSA